LGVPANLAGFRIPKIIVHEGDDVDQIIKDMEARGEMIGIDAWLCVRTFPASAVAGSAEKGTSDYDGCSASRVTR